MKLVKSAIVLGATSIFSLVSLGCALADTDGGYFNTTGKQVTVSLFDKTGRCYTEYASATGGGRYVSVTGVAPAFACGLINKVQFTIAKGNLNTVTYNLKVPSNEKKGGTWLFGTDVITKKGIGRTKKEVSWGDHTSDVTYIPPSK